MDLQTGHVGLNVTDLSGSVDFYRKVFGFDVIEESRSKGKEYAFLGTRGKLLVTLWQQCKGHFEKNSPGLHHLSFQAESMDEVKKAESTLKSMSARFSYEGVVPHREGSSSGGVFFEDPDGIRLEIYSPAGAEKAKMPEPDVVMTCGFF